VGVVLFGLSVLPSAALGKPLSDSVSSTLNLKTEPGLIEIIGQQNLSRRFGLLAGYQREVFLNSTYSGWKFGSNWLLARILSDSWISNAILSFGLSGMESASHGQMAVWAGGDLDWETRHFMVALAGTMMKGTQMPQLNTGQIRLAYSPLVAEMNSIQPWFLLSALSRSGAGGLLYFAVLRLVNTNWWLEIGNSLSTQDKLLNFSIAL
jgi:hypothetical protein